MGVMGELISQQGIIWEHGDQQQQKATAMWKLGERRGGAERNKEGAGVTKYKMEL